VAPAVELRALSRDDDRTGFSCGNAELDRFFVHYAGQNQFRLGLATTYVAVMEGRLVGFATVAVSSIERSVVPSARLKKKLPRYPLPVLRLARLGVDVRAQGHGIGRALLSHVLVLALRLRDDVGCIGVVADAKPEAIAFYQRLGFLLISGVTEGVLTSEPTPMFIATETIRDALGG
jgi:GNAT superfamily N-acetyltransferase